MCWLEEVDALAVIDAHGQLCILDAGIIIERLQIVDPVRQAWHSCIQLHEQ